MKNIIVAAFAAIVLGAAIASCGNNGNVATATATPTPVATPSTPCTNPPVLPIQVVYPAPNSVGISTGTIVIAAPSPLPTNYKLYVNSVISSSPTETVGTAFGSQLQVIPISQVPTGALNPPFLAIYESSYFGGLFGAGLTFSVYLANDTCFPGTSLDASFST